MQTKEQNANSKELTHKEKIFKNVLNWATAMILIGQCLLLLGFWYLTWLIVHYYSAFLIPGIPLVIMIFTTAVLICVVFSLVRHIIYVPVKKYNLPLIHHNIQVFALLEKIYADMQRYSKSAYSYYRAVRLFKISTIILSGLSTIILGLHFESTSGWLKVDYTVFSKNVALIIGTVITGYSSLMAFFNLEKYWLINKTMSNKLKSLLDNIEDADKANKLDTQYKIEDKVAEYKKIKDDFYKYWEGALSDREATH